MSTIGDDTDLLAILNSPNNGLRLFLVERALDGSEYVLLHRKFTHIDDGLEQHFIDITNKFLEYSTTLHTYQINQIDDLQRDQCFYVDTSLNDEYGIHRLLWTFSNDVDMEPVDNTIERLKDARYLLLRVRDNLLGEVGFYFPLQRRKQIKKPFLALNGGEAVFDSTPRYQLPNHHDWLFVCTGTKVYITDRGMTDLLGSTSLINHLRESAASFFSEIETLDIFANADDFRQACEGNLRVLKRLETIASRAAYRNLDAAKITQFNNEYSLNLAFDNQQIVYSYQSLWPILRLLNDDCLQSQLTTNKYVSHSKETI